MRRALTPLFVLGALVLYQANAGAVVIRFVGPHPIDPTLTKGLCYLEGPHVHSYEPHKKLLYVQAGPAWAFVGDPTEFDRDAPKTAYYGHHPAFWAEVDDTGLPNRGDVRYYCFISGPHQHLVPPPAELRFKEKGNAYFFVGVPPPWYKAQVPLHRDLDRHYGTVVIDRPVVTVSPPEGYIEITPWGGPRHVRVHGYGPRVEVHVPAPTFGIIVGGGGPPGPVFVGPGGHGHGHGHGHGGPPAWGHHKGKGKGKGKWK